ncbi:MAG: hypothetical protein R3C19_02735 [Planctomycetaceae bacterium]
MYAGMVRFFAVVVCVQFSVAAGVCCAGETEHCRIRVIDESTGRGVPLVELKTVNDIRYVTDSAGVVAFDEPD